MSRKAPAVQLYAQDFLDGTKFMSNAEVGLYIRMLCEQVDKGSVPDNVELFTRPWGADCKKVWAAVRSKFVEGSQPGTIVNERMAQAIADRDAFRARQKAKSDLAIAARTGKKSGSPTDIPTGQPAGDPLGDGVIHTVRKERAKSPDGFDEFWTAYPIHKAKAAAMASWSKLKPEHAALCKGAIEAQVKANHFRGTDGNDYVPHASTWLNQRRWEDEIQSNKAVLNINGGMTKEQADAEMRAIRIKNGRDPVFGMVNDHECSRELLIYRGRIKRA